MGHNEQSVLTLILNELAKAVADGSLADIEELSKAYQRIKSVANDEKGE